MWLGAHKSDSHERNGKGCGFLLPTLPWYLPTASLGEGCLFQASGETLCFVQDPPAPLQSPTQFTDAAELQSGRLAAVIPLNLVQETKQRVEESCVEAKPVGTLS